eukprot:SAG31_NODE_6414_length_2028_cov_9.931052_2_plen_174_part_00
MAGDVIDRISRTKEAPPHKIRLFTNATCLLMRNLNPALGLVNNARVIIIGDITNAHTIPVRLVGDRTNTVHLIPRIAFKFRLRRRDNRSPFVCRHQFPLRLSYAITFNRSQGQTLRTVGLDFRHDTFSHGQTYVAFGRVRNARSIMVLHQLTANVDGRVFVTNITYPSILAHL